ncbi:aspartate kinase [Peptostreptococcus russellii]|uniref:aspartate kinase n=1 Tax=Peptostreptococcus russellii TaxID=215200 RepID=UPI001624F12E|nr:aspartate kinase [Peptostreptococcus russellii]MBC2577057.1 aspartate kinase [Peptostreptococcus russellii]
MGIVVQKYGGSSVADVEKIMRVANRIVNAKKEGNQVVAIVSAMGKTTDNLISLANEINSRPPKREMDRLLSTGEQISMSLLAMAIDSLGENAVSLTGPQAGIRTDSKYSKAKIVNIVSNRLKNELENDNIIIVAGFQGETEEHDIATLGRGGSDTSAVSIAAALNADLCEIFTDVDGVYSCDPRIVPKAKKLSAVSYDAMLELALLGAKVLHPRAVEVAKSHGVEIHVRSSFSHDIGTIVKKEVSEMEHDGLITGIAHDKNVAKVVIFGVPDTPGTAAKIFKALADENISIQMIVQSAQIKNINDIAFTCSTEDAKEAADILRKIGEKIGAERVIINENIAKVSVIGAGMMTHSNIASRMFNTLGENNINIDLISTSEITISVTVDLDQCEKAVETLAKEFDIVE